MANKKNIQKTKPKQAKVRKVLQIVEPTKKNEVRYELQTALAPLFQPVNDVGIGERAKRLVRRELKNGWIEFACFEELSIFDESVSLAILRIASNQERGRYLTGSPKTDLGQEMRKLIDPKNNITDKSVGMVREMSLYEIAQHMGFKRPSKPIYEYIRASLTRLARVFISQRNDIDGTETHGEIGFIQHKILDSGRISAVISPRLTMASFGEKGWAYALLSLDERNCLKGDIAKSAHRFLVTWLWRDGGRPIGLDTLACHVWCHWSSLSNNAKATMRERLKKALTQFNSLPNWKLTVSGRGTQATVYVIRGEGKLQEMDERSSD